MQRLLGADWNLDALHALAVPDGAGLSTFEVTDKDGNLIGYDLSIDLPMEKDGKTPKGYAAALVATLPALKSFLKTQVDAQAESLRLKLITPGSGQAMEYQEAYAEAQEVLAAMEADKDATFKPTDYPMLAASIGYDIDPDTSTPTTDVPGEARAVKAAYEGYQRAGSAIRAARLRGKAEIDSATNAADAQAAFAAIKWPVLA